MALQLCPGVGFDSDHRLDLSSAKCIRSLGVTRRALGRLIGVGVRARRGDERDIRSRTRAGGQYQSESQQSAQQPDQLKTAVATSA